MSSFAGWNPLTHAGVKHTPTRVRLRRGNHGSFAGWNPLTHAGVKHTQTRVPLRGVQHAPREWENPFRATNYFCY